MRPVHILGISIFLAFLPGLMLPIRMHIDHPAIDRDLCAFGVRLHADFSHSRLIAFSTEQFLKLADGLDVVDIAKRA